LDELIDSVGAGLDEHADRAADVELEMFNLEKERAKLLEGGPPTDIADQERLAEIAKELERLDRDRLINLGVVRTQTERLRELEEERAALAEKEFALKEAQQNLDFLKQQADLVKLVSENGLDLAEILGGVELGIDASEVGILEAMTRAIEGIIEQAQAALPGAAPFPVEPTVPIVPPEALILPGTFPVFDETSLKLGTFIPSTDITKPGNTFILNVTTVSSAEDIIKDFFLLEAMAGA
jgi:hypothetical protein